MEHEGVQRKARPKSHSLPSKHIDHRAIFETLRFEEKRRSLSHGISRRRTCKTSLLTTSGGDGKSSSVDESSISSDTSCSSLEYHRPQSAALPAGSHSKLRSSSFSSLGSTESLSRREKFEAVKARVEAEREQLGSSSSDDEPPSKYHSDEALNRHFKSRRYQKWKFQEGGSLRRLNLEENIMDNISDKSGSRRPPGLPRHHWDTEASWQESRAYEEPSCHASLSDTSAHVNSANIAKARNVTGGKPEYRRTSPMQAITVNTSFQHPYINIYPSPQDSGVSSQSVASSSSFSRVPTPPPRSAHSKVATETLLLQNRLLQSTENRWTPVQSPDPSLNREYDRTFRLYGISSDIQYHSPYDIRKWEASLTHGTSPKVYSYTDIPVQNAQKACGVVYSYTDQAPSKSSEGSLHQSQHVSKLPHHQAVPFSSKSSAIRSNGSVPNLSASAMPRSKRDSDSFRGRCSLRSSSASEHDLYESSTCSSRSPSRPRPMSMVLESRQKLPESVNSKDDQTSSSLETANKKLNYVMQRERERRYSAHLNDALKELEVIYQSLKLNDEDLLYRAERRDLPTKFQLSRFLSSDSGDTATEDLGISKISQDIHRPRQRAPSIRRSAIPDKLMDDFAYRRFQQKPTVVRNSLKDNKGSSYLLSSVALTPTLTVDKRFTDLTILGEPDVDKDDMCYRNYVSSDAAKVQPPHPPIGIPLGPLTSSSPSDYLHAKPKDGLRSVTHPKHIPDIVRDDMAFRNLRKDPRRAEEKVPRRVRAARSLSANFANILQVNGEKGEKSQSLSDILKHVEDKSVLNHATVTHALNGSLHNGSANKRVLTDRMQQPTSAGKQFGSINEIGIPLVPKASLQNLKSWRSILESPGTCRQTVDCFSDSDVVGKVQPLDDGHLEYLLSSLRGNNSRRSVEYTGSQAATKRSWKENGVFARSQSLPQLGFRKCSAAAPTAGNGEYKHSRPNSFRNVSSCRILLRKLPISEIGGKYNSCPLLNTYIPGDTKLKRHSRSLEDFACDLSWFGKTQRNSGEGKIDFEHLYINLINDRPESNLSGNRILFQNRRRSNSLPLSVSDGSIVDFVQKRPSRKNMSKDILLSELSISCIPSSEASSFLSLMSKFMDEDIAENRSSKQNILKQRKESKLSVESVQDILNVSYGNQQQLSIDQLSSCQGGVRPFPVLERSQSLEKNFFSTYNANENKEASGFYRKSTSAGELDIAHLDFHHKRDSLEINSILQPQTCEASQSNPIPTADDDEETSDSFHSVSIELGTASGSDSETSCSSLEFVKPKEHETDLDGDKLTRIKTSDSHSTVSNEKSDVSVQDTSFGSNSSEKNLNSPKVKDASLSFKSIADSLRRRAEKEALKSRIKGERERFLSSSSEEHIFWCAGEKTESETCYSTSQRSSTLQYRSKVRKLSKENRKRVVSEYSAVRNTEETSSESSRSCKTANGKLKKVSQSSNTIFTRKGPTPPPRSIAVRNSRNYCKLPYSNTYFSSPYHSSKTIKVGEHYERDLILRKAYHNNSKQSTLYSYTDQAPWRIRIPDYYSVSRNELPRFQTGSNFQFFNNPANIDYVSGSTLNSVSPVDSICGSTGQATARNRPWSLIELQPKIALEKARRKFGDAIKSRSETASTLEDAIQELEEIYQTLRDSNKNSSLSSFSEISSSPRLGEYKSEYASSNRGKQNVGLTNNIPLSNTVTCSSVAQDKVENDRVNRGEIPKISVSDVGQSSESLCLKSAPSKQKHSDPVDTFQKAFKKFVEMETSTLDAKYKGRLTIGAADVLRRSDNKLSRQTRAKKSLSANVEMLEGTKFSYSEKSLSLTDIISDLEKESLKWQSLADSVADTLSNSSCFLNSSQNSLLHSSVSNNSVETLCEKQSSSETGP